MWKRFIVRQIQNKIDLNEVLWARETKQPQKPLFSLKPLDTKPSRGGCYLSQPCSASRQKRTTDPSPPAPPADSVVEVFLRDNAMILAQDLSFRFCFCLTTIGQETSMIVNNKNWVSDIIGGAKGLKIIN